MSNNLTPQPRLALLPDYATSTGEPRPALLLPGMPPLVFPTMTAALTALRDMQAQGGAR